jgi:hypothetical protein
LKRIRAIHPTKPQYGVDLWRDDVGIFADNLINEQEFEIDFHANLRNPISDTASEALLISVLTALAEVPGIVVARK